VNHLGAERRQRRAGSAEQLDGVLEGEQEILRRHGRTRTRATGQASRAGSASHWLTIVVLPNSTGARS
jgi:hypothetical protein